MKRTAALTMISYEQSTGIPSLKLYSQLSSDYSQLLLNRPELPEQERIILEFLLDFIDRVHHGRVVAVREKYPEPYVADAEVLLPQEHDDLTRHQDLTDAGGADHVLDRDRVVPGDSLEHFLEGWCALRGRFEADDVRLLVGIFVQFAHDLGDAPHRRHPLLEFVLRNGLHQNPLKFADVLRHVLGDEFENRPVQ